MQAFSVLRSPLQRSALHSSRAAWRSNANVLRAVRRYSTESPNPSAPSGGASKTPLYLGLGALVAGGIGYWVFTSDSSTAREAATAAKSGAQIIKAKGNFVPSQADYQKVYNKIAELVEDAGDYDDGSYGPVLVRLAWHASGTYDKDTKSGGSNYATMRFEPESLHGANNGLNVARGLMEKVKAQFPWISYGDLWTLAGVCAIQEMSGPKIPWRAGRIDGFAKDATPDGRLPDATQGGTHLRSIFNRMGFDDQEIVALSGAHALGRCHTDRSGFEGPWTFSPTTLTNDYYKLLFDEKWVWRKWTGPKQLQDKKTGTLMMLPTDYTLVTDKSFKQFGQKYAKDQEAFFKDFSAAFGKLLELGVPEAQWVNPQPWLMKSMEEQKVEKS